MQSAGNCGAGGVLSRGNVDDAWALKNPKRKELRPAALHVEAELRQNGQVATSTDGQQKVGIFAMRREKYILRAANLKCAKNECYFSGVGVALGGTSERWRHKRLQNAAEVCPQSPNPYLPPTMAFQNATVVSPTASHKRADSGGPGSDSWNGLLTPHLVAIWSTARIRTDVDGVRLIQKERPP